MRGDISLFCFVLLIDVRMDSFVYKMSKYLKMLMFYLTKTVGSSSKKTKKKKKRNWEQNSS